MSANETVTIIAAKGERGSTYWRRCIKSDRLYNIDGWVVKCTLNLPYLAITMYVEYLALWASLTQCH